MPSHKIRHPKKRAFLAAYAQVGNVTRAAELAEINRHTHYDWLQTDTAYVAAFADAEDQAADNLETEARRRAVEGTSKPVYQGGALVGHVQEYSDTLLIFLMKGARPDKYRENVRKEVVGAGGGPIQMQTRYAEMTDDELNGIISEFDARRAGELRPSTGGTGTQGDESSS